MGAVKGVIARNNGPYVIFAWTKHDRPEDDLFTAFKNEIMKDNDFPKPVVLINLEKNDCLGRSFASVNKKLMQTFNDKNILEFLFFWEKNASLAIRDVVKLLTEMSMPPIQAGQSFDDYSEKWNSELEKHICKISEMALGENIKADRKLLIAAQLALTNPFHDCIERRIWSDSRMFKSLTAKIMTHKTSPVTNQQRALLNTYFLLVSHDLDSNVQPGNIYLFNSVLSRLKCMTKSCYSNKLRITKTKIIEDFCQKNVSAGDKNQLVKDSVPILIEITPECDYVQNKWKHARCVLGVLWPENLERFLNKKLGYIFKPLPVTCEDKTYILTFNARHIFNFPFSVFKALPPSLKARKELLVDIQHWFSSHISRPGKTEF
ncbi:MAG: hypothetical protein KAV87_53365 [Desulfobacteraceae bacterium]|nr:hypothetical protein [Desulfobacteraceae bacterium]